MSDDPLFRPKEQYKSIISRIGIEGHGIKAIGDTILISCPPNRLRDQAKKDKFVGPRFMIRLASFPKGNLWPLGENF